MQQKIFFPKISIVTPNFNQDHYLESTINSVLGQDYPNLEYIIIDGGSTDRSVEIIRSYEKEINFWVSEKDSGMYEALNKGFKRSSGEIMGWINSDDVLLPGALKNIAKLFSDLPEVSWIQGLNSYIDLEGNVIATSSPKKFSVIKFLNKEYQWIQQESTFWKRQLWKQSGSKMDQNLKLAGDFELWFRFFQYEKLYNSSVPIGAWRRREGQLSSIFMEEYKKEANLIIESYLLQQPEPVLQKIKLIEKLSLLLDKIPIFNKDYFIKKKNRYLKLGRTDIEHSYEKQKFIIK